MVAQLGLLKLESSKIQQKENIALKIEVRPRWSLENISL